MHNVAFCVIQSRSSYYVALILFLFMSMSLPVPPACNSLNSFQCSIVMNCLSLDFCDSVLGKDLQVVIVVILAFGEVHLSVNCLRISTLNNVAWKV